MPIITHVLASEDMVEVKNGEGDVGFLCGTYKNYPEEKRVGVEVYAMTKSFPVGEGKEVEVKDEDFATEFPSVVLTFPANNPASIEAWIKVLTNVRDKYYPYYAVIFQKNLGQALEEGFTVYKTKNEAELSMADLLNLNSDHIKDLTIVEVAAKMEDVDDWGGSLHLKKGMAHQ